MKHSDHKEIPEQFTVLQFFSHFHSTQNNLILIVANRLQTGLQNKLQNGLFLFKIQLGTPQNIANEQLKH